VVAAAAIAVGLWASRSAWLRARLTSLFHRLGELRRLPVDRLAVARAFLFYVGMGVFNGVTFLAVVRSAPDGANCPTASVVAANAVAWLAGFVALFAPGGLVIREACLAALLSPWLPPGQAIMVALAWRLVQMISEVVCFVGVAAWGLPGSMVCTPWRGGDEDECRDRPISDLG
jgi:uncharacterized membrane protein YbhN (UPF0104 family)